MEYEVTLPTEMQKKLQEHLLQDSTKEQMAIVLCGLCSSKNGVRLLGRHLITMLPESFSHQSSVGITLDQSVQRYVLQRAANEGLSQVDFHTHPGDGQSVAFSSIDDRNETALARYLGEKLPGTIY